MNTLGERLRHARKSKGATQESLADTIGVSRGVIFNLEKNKTDPQAIVINAICQTLNIDKEWLQTGAGQMEDLKKLNHRAKTLAELHTVAKELSEEEQLYVLDVIRAYKARLGANAAT